MPDELHLQLLGGLHLTRGGIPVRGFLSAKVQALFCYLAVTGRPHSREALMALLWGDMQQERADHGLRQALSNLQKLAGPHLTVTRQSVSFNQDVPYYLDVELFLRLLDQAESGGLRPHRKLLEAANVYAGDFLDGFYVRDAPEFEEWVAGQREWLRQKLFDSLHRLAEHYISRGEYGVAAEHLNRLLGLDPWREDAHRQLMLLLAYQGRRDAAIAQYHVCRRVLLENIGEEPAEETTELYRKIREGTLEISRRQELPDNLPANIPPTFGRQEDAARIETLLEEPDCHLITLAGPGGVGKTHLALQVARNMADEFRDGTFFVSLSPVRDPPLVPNTIARTLGIEASPGHSVLESLSARLRDKEMFLVLDNFEHLMPSAPLVADLLSSSPHLRMLVTSRARLRLRAEQVYTVPPLALPPLDDPALPEVISQFPSVAMFAERAALVRPGFAVNDANARVVAEICHRLEGLPLAIELAAARLNVLPVQALLARLENRLRVLTGGARDLPTRQQTLRATIEWSYDLLSQAQQALLRILSVFAGGCAFDALEDIHGAEDGEGAGGAGNVECEEGLLETLSTLVDNSLVVREEQAGGDVRFRMLETVREYAFERLVASGDEDQIRRRHAEYYLRLAQRAQAELRGPQQLEWLNGLDTDHNNLRVALRWALDGSEHEGGTEAGLELGMRAAAALCRFWEMRGYLSEGRQWLDELLARRQAVAPESRAIALRSAGILALGQGDLTRSAELCSESLQLYTAMGDTPGRAGALNSLGNARRELDDLEGAQALYEQGLALYREMGDPLGIAVVLNNLGAVTQLRGDLAHSAELYEESLALRRASDDTRGVAYTLNRLGGIAHQQGDLGRAEALCRESLQMRHKLGDKHGTILTLTTLATITYDQGDDAATTDLIEQSLVLCRELGETWGLASGLRILGSIAQRRGGYEQARQLYEESFNLFRSNEDSRGVALVLSDLATLSSSD